MLNIRKLYIYFVYFKLYVYFEWSPPQSLWKNYARATPGKRVTPQPSGKTTGNEIDSFDDVIQCIFLEHPPCSIFPRNLMQMERATEFNDLPEDVTTLIFAFLDGRLLRQASAVCRHWARLTKDHSLWKTVDLRNKIHFGNKTWSEGQVMNIISNCMSLHTTDLIVECTLGSI